MTHLTKDQMLRLLEVAKRRDVRLYAMILLGWRHGLRATEICNLRVQDFDLFTKHERGQILNEGFITVARLKGSLRTTQALFSDELQILPRFLQGKGPTEYVFPGRKPGRPFSYAGFYDRFRGLCEDLGLPAHVCHPHILKHSAGMTVIKSGIEYARQYLGHRSIASTGAYLRVSDTEASRAAMAAFGD